MSHIPKSSYRFSPNAACKYMLIAKAEDYLCQKHEINVNVGSFRMLNEELVKDADEVK